MLAEVPLSSIKSDADRYWRLLREIHAVRGVVEGLKEFPEFESAIANLPSNRIELVSSYFEQLEQEALKLYSEATYPNADKD